MPSMDKGRAGRIASEGEGEEADSEGSQLSIKKLERLKVGVQE